MDERSDAMTCYFDLLTWNVGGRCYF